MPFLGRRMARAAVVGGAAYYAGKRRTEGQYQEDDQEARLEALEAQQNQGQQPAPAAPPPAAAEPAEADYTDELEQLAKLHEQGVLTDEEFSAKKKAILGL